MLPSRNDNQVGVVDVYVDELDLADLGFNDTTSYSTNIIKKYNANL